MIGGNDGCIWVIADLVSCAFGVKIQNWEKSGKRMSSHDVQIFSRLPLGGWAEFGRGFDKTDGVEVRVQNA